MEIDIAGSVADLTEAVSGGVGGTCRLLEKCRCGSCGKKTCISVFAFLVIGLTIADLVADTIVLTSGEILSCWDVGSRDILWDLNITYAIFLGFSWLLFFVEMMLLTRTSCFVCNKSKYEVSLFRRQMTRILIPSFITAVLVLFID